MIRSIIDNNSHYQLALSVEGLSLPIEG